VIIAMSILSMILGFAAYEFATLVHHFAKTSTMLDSEREARTLMARVAFEMRQASPNINVQPGNQPVSDPLTFDTAADHIYFTQPSQNTPLTSADPAALKYDTVRIMLDTAVPAGHDYPDLILQRTDPQNKTTTAVLGLDVKSFQVTPRSKAIYDIDLTVAPRRRADQATDAKQQFSLHSTIYISYFKE
jgi:type II secretory pathway component PulJ